MSLILQNIGRCAVLLFALELCTVILLEYLRHLGFGCICYIQEFVIVFFFCYVCEDVCGVNHICDYAQCLSEYLFLQT